MEEQNKNAETKTEENKQESKELEPKAYIKIAVGLVLVILGAWAILGWWNNLMILVKGSIGCILILAGAVTIAIAKE